MCIIDKRAVGTVRISLGYPTIIKDIDTLLQHFQYHFLNYGPNPIVHPISSKFIVSKLFVFPVVGMMGFSVDNWILTTSGLKYDRSWKLCDQDGHVVTTTECHSLATLFASVSLETNILTIHNCLTNEKIELTAIPEQIQIDNSSDNYNLVPDVVKKQGIVYSSNVSDFIMNATGRFLYLLRVNQRESGRFSMSCVTEESIKAIGGIDPLRLRSNVLFKGSDPFSEEGKMEKKLKFAGFPLTVWRWRVICMTTSVVPKTGEIDTKPLKQLTLLRGRSGMAPFGCLFSVDCGNQEVQVGVGDTLEP